MGDKIKLFVFDLDGTALGTNHRPYAKFTKKFCKFLDEISENQILWCINTTWDINGQWDLILNSPLKSRPIFLMGEFGKTFAKVGKDGPLMFEEYNKLMEKKVIHYNKKYINKIIRKLVNKFYPKRMYFYGHFFSFMVDKENVYSLHNYVKENFSKISKIKIYFGEDGIMFVPSFLNKGKILLKAEKILKIVPEEVIVAGDSVIDIPMMSPKLAKYLICPSNSEKEVKEIVEKNNGIVASKPFSEGVIEGFKKLKANFRYFYQLTKRKRKVFRLS